MYFWPCISGRFCSICRFHTPQIVFESVVEERNWWISAHFIVPMILFLLSFAIETSVFREAKITVLVRFCILPQITKPLKSSVNILQFCFFPHVPDRGSVAWDWQDHGVWNPVAFLNWKQTMLFSEREGEDETRKKVQHRAESKTCQKAPADICFHLIGLWKRSFPASL